jgi:hypothetical protein
MAYLFSIYGSWIEPVQSQGALTFSDTFFSFFVSSPFPANPYNWSKISLGAEGIFFGRSELLVHARHSLKYFSPRPRTNSRASSNDLQPAFGFLQGFPSRLGTLSIPSQSPISTHPLYWCGLLHCVQEILNPNDTKKRISRMFFIASCASWRYSC